MFRMDPVGVTRLRAPMTFRPMPGRKDPRLVLRCQSGIDYGVPPSCSSAGGTHWVGAYTCMNGVNVTKPVPSGQVPGGG